MIIKKWSENGSYRNTLTYVFAQIYNKQRTKLSLSGKYLNQFSTVLDNLPLFLVYQSM